VNSSPDKFIGPGVGDGLLARIISEVIGDFASSIEENALGRTPVFLSREGYWLEKWWQGKTGQTGQSFCLPISRTGINRMLIRKFEDVLFEASRGYDGSLLLCLVSRFGLSLAEIREGLVEDHDREVVLLHCSNVSRESCRETQARILNRLEYKIDAEIVKLRHFVSSIESNPAKRLYVDLGYSGTIPYGLDVLLDEKVEGYFWCTTTLGRARGYQSRWGAYEWSGPESLLNLSFFLETLLRSPHPKFRAFNPSAVGPDYEIEVRPRSLKCQSLLDQVHHAALQRATFRKITIDDCRGMLREGMKWLMNFDESGRRSLIEPETWNGASELFPLKQIGIVP
jgi:hypothetical protein